MIDSAVIIVNYDAGHLLREAVQSALAEGTCEVVVVDNAATDRSIETLTDAIEDEKVDALWARRGCFDDEAISNVGHAEPIAAGNGRKGTYA